MLEVSTCKLFEIAEAVKISKGSEGNTLYNILYMRRPAQDDCHYGNDCAKAEDEENCFKWKLGTLG